MEGCPDGRPGRIWCFEIGAGKAAKRHWRKAWWKKQRGSRNWSCQGASLTRCDDCGGGDGDGDGEEDEDDHDDDDNGAGCNSCGTSVFLVLLEEIDGVGKRNSSLFRNGQSAE